MPWQLVMLFQNTLAAVFAVNARTIAMRFPRATLPFNLLIYFTIATSGLIYAVVHGWGQVSWAALGHYLPFFILGGLAFAATNIISFVVFQYVDAAIATLLSTFNIIAAVALSTVVLQEGLDWRQATGAAVLIAGMELVLTINISRYKHKRMVHAVMLSLLAAGFFAVATTTEKYLLNHVNLSTYLTFGWGFQFAGVLAMAALLGRRAKADWSLLASKRFYQFALPASVIRMSAGMLFVFSLKLANNLSVISVLSGLKVIFAALLAACLLRERDYLPRKLEAAGLATLGIALLYW